MKNRQKAGGSLLLMLTALIWGVAFVAQSVGMEYVGPFTFNAVRSFVGALALVPWICMAEHRKKKGKNTAEQALSSPGELVKGGILCGVLLCIASSLQQIGIGYTTVGKAGFLTALYIVIVPVLGIFTGKRTGLLLWVSVALAAAGLYFLCMTEELSIGKGDRYVLLCAAVFSLHILAVDHYSPRVDAVKLSCIQFLVCGVLAGAPALLWEEAALSGILAAWAPVLYAGVLSCGVGYTLQVVGQQHLSPTVASLILSMESLFSVLAGWLILGQRLKGREILGCVLMAAAIVLAQTVKTEAKPSF
ncbi:MAG: DMT family transporter [Lachnospiraceae bacterium]|jgi:drug/metabolite transporter (DMT)-like permease|nr:DMT family transporter [Lachnospiraceae bacterium]